MAIHKGACQCYTRKVSGEWRSPAARLVRDEEVGGSNPLSPTAISRDLALRVLGSCFSRSSDNLAGCCKLDNSDRQRALRTIPSVDAVMRELDDQASATLGASASLKARVVRNALNAAREGILDGSLTDAGDVVAEIQDRLDFLASGDVAAVINATGVIVHTNLGRAPVSKATAVAMGRAASNYLPLEVRLDTGLRGGRGEEVSALMAALTGAESTLAVNNNAAAILLTLSALCAGKSVLISRGEAVEIGGGFRIPDVMRQSGAKLVEVGTTNRTNLRDYADAIDDETAAILSVHASNFEISGFTHKPQLAELAEIARLRGVLLIEDVGSGCLVDTTRFGLDHEPTLAESIEAGVDVVTASGDKLLGGPQAGLILGSAACLDEIRKHPLARAVRTDKSVQHGLAATLRHYIREDHVTEVPIWWMMSRTTDFLQKRAEEWLSELDSQECKIVSTTSVTGGGSLPGKSQPSFGLAIQPDSCSPSALAAKLRAAKRPIFSRIEDDQVILDARTVLPEQDADLLETLMVTLG
jgi:L-seryl-tRNA(Ser) seleniumtransferase